MMFLLMIRRFSLLFVLLAGVAAGSAGGAVAAPLDEAGAMMQSGAYSQAISVLQARLDTQPDDYEAAFMAGMAYAQLGRFPEAIEMFHHVATMKPELAEPHANLAKIYHEQGQYEAAVGELNRVLAMRSGDPVVEQNLADLHLLLALKHYRFALDGINSGPLWDKYRQLARLQESDGMPVVKADDVAKPSTMATVVEAPVQAVVAVPTRTVVPKGDEAVLLSVLEGWRSAWSSQDTNAYFSHYSPDFRPEARHDQPFSYQAWQRYKQRVIAAAGSIQLKLSGVTVALSADGEQAQLRFAQSYDSSRYHSKSRKMLTMQKQAGAWKIIREQQL